MLNFAKKMTKKERNKLICDRYDEGYSQEELGRFYDLSQSAVSLIILNKSRWLKEEEEQERRGAKSKLNQEELEELKLILTKPSEETEHCRYWNKWNIKELIQDKFGVSYHQNYIWSLMKQLGLSSQLPQKKDYRQDKKIVEAYKKDKIPQIKKSKI